MLLAALLLQTAPMATPATCPATPAPLPRELAGWTTALPVTAGATGATTATLPVGRGARATLLSTGSVRLPVAPAKPAGAGSNSGVFAFAVPVAGRYRIALGAGVWVDVIGGSVALPSVAHGHGPACSPVRKTVDFDLKPGRYLLQVVGSTAPALSLMIARVN